MIFAAPENLAATSGLPKDIFDRRYYRPARSHRRSPDACLVCAGSDGRNTARQIEHRAHDGSDLRLGW
jgi:hypothetical protein